MKRLSWNPLKVCVLLAIFALAVLPAPAIGAPLSQGDGPQAQADQHMAAGRDYLAANDYAAALQELEQALSLYRTVENQEGEAMALLNLGYAYRGLGDEAAAIEQFEQALTLFQELKYQAAEAVASEALGWSELWTGHPDSALAYFEAALPVYQALNKESMARYVQMGAAMALTLISTNQVGLGQYTEAEAGFLRAIDLCRASQYQPCAVSARNNLGEMYDKLGRYTEALAQHQQAQEACAVAGDMCGGHEANILANLGRDYVNLGDYDQGLDALQQALEAARAVPDQNLEGTILNSMGAANSHLARYGEALAQFHAAQDVFQAIGFLEGLEATHINIGELFQQTGRPQDALREYEAARELAAQIPDPEGEATVIGNVATVYQETGQYEEAIRGNQAALEIWQRIGNIDGQAVTHNALGVIMTYLGQFETAEQHYQAAVDLRVQAGDPNGIAVTASNLADLYYQLGRYDEALQQAIKSRDQAHSIGAAALEVSALDNMAAIQQELGQYEDAQANHRAALTIRQAIGDRRGEGASRVNLGSLYGDQNKYPDALAQYQAALKIFEETGQITEQAQLLGNIGRIYRHQRNLAEAIRSSQEAVEVSESVQGMVRVEELATSFAAGQLWLYNQLIDMLVESGEPGMAFNYAERARARAFLDQIGNQRVDLHAGADAGLLAQEQGLRERVAGLQNELNAESAKPIDQQNKLLLDSLSANLEQARKDYQELFVRLQLESPEYASLVSVTTLSLEDVQKQVLDTETTLIEYFVLDDQVLAWVIDQEGSELVTLDKARDDLRKQVEFLRNLITSREFDAAAADLYNALFAPLKPHIHRPNLVIVPHGVLHYLPFAALWDAENGRYLVQDYALSYAPSASALKFILAKRSPDDGRVLAMGNPDGSLPYAKDEAQAVARLYGTVPLLEEEAVESQVYAQAGQVDVLHLAAHGKYNAYNALYSRIELAPDAAEDGNLEVHEVYGLDLSGTNLVVLSACQTALGKQSEGDEVVGLTRAFLYAGTPAVVTTLWSVDDAASGAEMEAFYRYLREGLTNAEALRAAQVELMAEEGWSEPYYWAAFSLTGDYRGYGDPHMAMESAGTPAATAVATPTVSAVPTAAAGPAPAPARGGLCGGSAALPLGLALLFGAVRPHTRRRAS